MKLRMALEAREAEEEEAQQANGANKKKKKKKKQTHIQRLFSRQESHLCKLPTLGFNCGKHDLNVEKRWLIWRFDERKPKLTTAVKKGNHFMLLLTKMFQFLDVRNFQALMSLDQFLKEFRCSRTKGTFPYEWLHSVDNLSLSHLPP